MLKNRGVNMNAINRAVKVAGNQTKLASLLGVKQPAVNQWVKGHRPIPPMRAIAIEKLTGVSREELCPQVFLEK